MSSSAKSRNSAHSASEGSSIHSNLLRESKENVFKKYEVLEVLGNGSMGSVCMVRVISDKVGGSAVHPKAKGLQFGILGKVFRKKLNNPYADSAKDEVYALKSIHLDRISDMFLEELRNEIEILRNLDHPHVVKAHEVYYQRNNKQIYLVLECCTGGDLYSRTPYSEKDAGCITQQITSAIRYLHDHRIVHRDLKFENILFRNDSPCADIKILDFGLSKKFMGNTPDVMTDRVGTVYTMSPQVLQGVYTSSADCWALGVISFMLLGSYKPFHNKRRSHMIDSIMRGKYHFHSEIWDKISGDAKDFVSKLLVVDPRERMTAAEAIEHRWILNREKCSEEKTDPDVIKAVGDSLLNYKQTSSLKRIALNVIAHRASSEEILKLRPAFAEYDTAKNGIITYNEFKIALEKMNYSEESLQEIFESIDVNKDGHIQYTEFLAATLEAHGELEERRIAEAFDRLDSDDTGFISKDNLKEILGKDFTPEKVDELMLQCNPGKDGKVTYPEFLAFFRKKTRAMVEIIDREPSSMDDSESELVGLDAKIPGGRYDPNKSSF